MAASVLGVPQYYVLFIPSVLYGTLSPLMDMPGDPIGPAGPSEPLSPWKNLLRFSELT